MSKSGHHGKVEEVTFGAEGFLAGLFVSLFLRGAIFATFALIVNTLVCLRGSLLGRRRDKELAGY